MAEWELGREFLKVVAEQTLKFGNITKINEIINTVSDNLITSMKKNEMLAYVPQLVKFDTENLVTDQILGESQTLNKVSFFIADEEETKNLFSNLVEEINQTEN